MEYRKIVPISFRRLWSYNLNLSRAYIGQLVRLLLGHNRLPAYAFKLGFNQSLVCPRHRGEEICDFCHLVFSCPALESLRAPLLSRLYSHGVPLDTVSVMASSNLQVIFLIVKFLSPVFIICLLV